METELSDSWFSLETFAGILHRGTAHFLPARTEWGNCEDGETHLPSPCSLLPNSNHSVPGTSGRAEDLAVSRALMNVFQEIPAARTLEAEKAQFKSKLGFLWVCFLNCKIRLTTNLNSKCCKVDEMRKHT